MRAYPRPYASPLHCGTDPVSLRPDGSRGPDYVYFFRFSHGHRKRPSRDFSRSGVSIQRHYRHRPDRQYGVPIVNAIRTCNVSIDGVGSGLLNDGKYFVIFKATSNIALADLTAGYLLDSAIPVSPAMTLRHRKDPCSPRFPTFFYWRRLQFRYPDLQQGGACDVYREAERCGRRSRTGAITIVSLGIFALAWLRRR